MLGLYLNLVFVVDWEEEVNIVIRVKSLSIRVDLLYEVYLGVLPLSFHQVCPFSSSFDKLHLLLSFSFSHAFEWLSISSESSWLMHVKPLRHR